MFYQYWLNPKLIYNKQSAAKFRIGKGSETNRDECSDVDI